MAASNDETWFTTPGPSRLLTEADYLLEESLQDVDPEPLANPRHAGMIGQNLTERMAEAPAVSQVAVGHREELALRANALADHHQLQREDDNGIDAGPADLGTIFGVQSRT